MRTSITLAIVATLASTFTYAGPVADHKNKHHSSSTSSSAAPTSTTATYPVPAPSVAGCPYDNPSPNFQKFAGNFCTYAAPVGITSTGFETCGTNYAKTCYDVCKISCDYQLLYCQETQPDQVAANAQNVKCLDQCTITCG